MKHVTMLALILTTISSYATGDIQLTATDTTQVEEDEVVYKVFNDDHYIYLHLSTTHKRTSMSIIRNGLTVYFDVKGKKNKDVYIKYPSKNEPENGKRNPREKGERDERGERDALRSIDIGAMIEKIPGEAQYGFYDEEYQFHKDLNAQDISLGYSTNGEALEFVLKVPKNKIKTKKKKKKKIDFSKLSIGVVTNTRNRPDREQRQHQEQQQRPNRSNGNFGDRGMRGGTGQMGRGNGNGGGGNRGNRPNQGAKEANNIDFWFDAQLKE